MIGGAVSLDAVVSDRPSRLNRDGPIGYMKTLVRPVEEFVRSLGVQRTPQAMAVFHIRIH
jgi:hypothetical protein